MYVFLHLLYEIRLILGHFYLFISLKCVIRWLILLSLLWAHVTLLKCLNILNIHLQWFNIYITSLKFTSCSWCKYYKIFLWKMYIYIFFHKHHIFIVVHYSIFYITKIKLSLPQFLYFLHLYFWVQYKIV
jgi:hypothetical protein